MGMMNNPWFRIKVYLVPRMKWFEFWWQKSYMTDARASRSPRRRPSTLNLSAQKVHPIRDNSPGGMGKVVAVRFEHPTLAGTQAGGWMTRGEKEAGWKRTKTGAILGLHQAPYDGTAFDEVPPLANTLARTHTHSPTRVHTHARAVRGNKGTDACAGGITYVHENTEKSAPHAPIFDEGGGKAHQRERQLVCGEGQSL